MADPIKPTIILNFGWEGPSSIDGGWSRGGLEVGIVDLVFKNSTTEVSVGIPDDISPITAQVLPIKCREDGGTGGEINVFSRTTQYERLEVTVEQIRNLTLKAGFFSESPYKGNATMDHLGNITHERRVLRSDREVALEVPEELESGKCYTLIVTSDQLELSARLEKRKEEAERKPTQGEEYRRRVGNMGNALIQEGVKNLELASKGGDEVFDSNADLFAHMMQGVARAGQQMHPELEVPHTQPPETLESLEKLTTEVLQARFEETSILDKKYESQRIQTALAGNIAKINSILEIEQANSQLLILLAQALEKRGIQPLIPQSANFQAAAHQAAEDQTDMIDIVQEQCKMQ